MTTASIVVTFLIAGLLTASQITVFSPRIAAGDLERSIIALQRLGRDYRAAFCGSLPTSISAKDMTAALDENGPGYTASVQFSSFNGHGSILVVLADERQAAIAARAGGGTSSGNVATIPVPLRRMRDPVGLQDLRALTTGGSRCW